MKKKFKLILILICSICIAILCVVSWANYLSAKYDNNTHNTGKRDYSSVTDTAEVEEKSQDFLSITYTAEDEETSRGRMMKFYTYDLLSKKLSHVVNIPFASQYAVGCVDKKNNKVYYSSEEKGTDIAVDHLSEYNIKTKKSRSLESQNRAYNDIIVKGNSLLVTAIPVHAIGTGKFDLDTYKFDYFYPMKKNEDGYIDFLYTTRPVHLNYNPVYDRLCNVSAKEADLYAYKVRTGEKGLTYTLKLFDSDGNVKGKCKFKIQSLLHSEVVAMAQTGLNHALLAEFYEKDRFADESERESCYRFYDIDFEHQTYKRTQSPFPEMVSIKNFITFDNGKSYYILGEHKDGRAGLFYYQCNDNNAQMILANDEKNDSHIVNFCCVSQ